MISMVNTFTNEFALALNFFAHAMIFIGAFYVAIHNRDIPNWTVTTLWYISLFSLFVAITIILQWAVGSNYPLSYFNVGYLGETLGNVTLAGVAVVMLVHTVRVDVKNKSKGRQKQEE